MGKMGRLYRRVKVLYLMFWTGLMMSITLYLLGMDSPAWTMGYVSLLAVIILFTLIANVKLHQLAVKEESNRYTLGLKATVLSCLFLTPLEAVIVLPAINLYRLKR
ncbi:hypothetical protein [Shewanella surugensis]|uniref:DUF4234 domain-containing protein n=1 Tax=Shewanella surugensis TaxID=212020 RepID=A0ABT0LK24_9GAMM|nr:hypothetical protein [Shewanella surugensis]MCL1127476.1 hypothetical protein [Shewanella surugensis]